MAKVVSKKDRFKLVAGRRVQKILDDLESLSKCSNTSAYDYTEEDIRKMMKAINDKMALLKLSFQGSRKSKKQTFEF